jgi:hypothetical protein
MVIHFSRNNRCMTNIAAKSYLNLRFCIDLLNSPACGYFAYLVVGTYAIDAQSLDVPFLAGAPIAIAAFIAQTVGVVAFWLFRTVDIVTQRHRLFAPFGEKSRTSLVFGRLWDFGLVYICLSYVIYPIPHMCRQRRNVVDQNYSSLLCHRDPLCFGHFRNLSSILSAYAGGWCCCANFLLCSSSSNRCHGEWLDHCRGR